jgi:hypothetical protein
MLRISPEALNVSGIVAEAPENRARELKIRGLAETFTYDRRILEELSGHGLSPLPTTPPQRIRNALSDLYRYEIRRLRSDLLAGRIQKQDYAPGVIELRKRYWLLSVPVHLWTFHP